MKEHLLLRHAIYVTSIPRRFSPVLAVLNNDDDHTTTSRRCSREYGSPPSRPPSRAHFLHLPQRAVKYPTSVAHQSPYRQQRPSRQTPLRPPPQYESRVLSGLRLSRSSHISASRFLQKIRSQWALIMHKSRNSVRCGAQRVRSSTTQSLA